MIEDRQSLKSKTSKNKMALQASSDARRCGSYPCRLVGLFGWWR